MKLARAICVASGTDRTIRAMALRNMPTSAGGKTSYINASRTLREGLELNIRHQWDRHWKTVGSLTAMRATYDQGFTSRSSTGAPVSVLIA